MDQLRRWAGRRKAVVASLAVALVLLGMGVVVGGYYFDSIPPPDQLELPEATTVYFADGNTPMAKLGSENRTLLTFDEMNDAVKESVVAAEDQTFWTNEGIDFFGVMRAAWNNVSGGDTQGASTITQQYARIAASLKGVTYSRKLREAVMAWKLDDKYDKKQILEFYLNTVPFGRGSYGIEAASRAYLGKTANRNAPPDQQVTTAEAMLLVAMIKQPEPNPDNPEAEPGYDPTRGEIAKNNSKNRWEYVRSGMVSTGALTQAEADALRYPETVIPFDPTTQQSGMDLPTGLVVSHALSELRQSEEFKNRPADYVQNGGFRIVTTIDKRAQDAAEAAADIRRDTTPAPLRGQPANWQAALVGVEPGTGRVLAYYGGNDGTGSDYAGWYLDDTGHAVGYGAHPPGSSFKVYDLAEALRQNVKLDQPVDAPPTKEFPNSGRTAGTPAGPVRNASTAPCQPSCTLMEATVASLNVPFFALTEQLGTANVLEMAAKSGVDYMWANQAGQPEPVRTELRGKPGRELASTFSTEVGIGQYGITVLDHANGMATMAAGGQRSQAHFVKEVLKDDQRVYAEHLTKTSIGLNADQSTLLDFTLSKVPTAKFANDWDAAGKTGTWQAGQSITENAHTWMVGYTKALAAAVWVGTTDGTALITANGSTEVFGANYPGPIWQQFMRDATKAMQFDTKLSKFAVPKVTASPTPSPTPAQTTQAPTPTPAPTRTTQVPTPTPTPVPTRPPGPPNPSPPEPSPVLTVPQVSLPPPPQ